MQYTTLGRTGCKVSRLCLGTMNFGPQTDEQSSYHVMDKALDLGINFFDTADVYGWKRGEGVTEQIIGRWWAQGGGRRERVVIATKVFGDMDLDSADITMKRGLSAVKIKRACEGSLKRLQTDYIDLYQMHHIARESHFDEIWQAFDTLIKQGKILYAGSSNFAGWHIAKANEQAAKKNMVGLVSEQSKYSLACRAIELEVIPACKDYGVGVIPWSPLDGGFLGDVLTDPDKKRRAGEGMVKRIEAERPRLEKWAAFCQSINEKCADVALAWMLHNPTITAPIIGPRTMDQLTGCLRSLDIKLTDDHLKAIDKIWPGPKGHTDEGVSDWAKQAAPEAYAW
jgi:aryl-alcohol dehydrogenase-like predicted oxidoreductase